jgi:hypothetical protein
MRLNPGGPVAHLAPARRRFDARQIIVFSVTPPPLSKRRIIPTP